MLVRQEVWDFQVRVQVVQQGVVVNQQAKGKAKAVSTQILSLMSFAMVSCSYHSYFKIVFSYKI